MEAASRQHDVLARAATLLCILCTPPDAAAERAGRELEILGYVERAVLLDPPLALDAKLDTGAETSSLGTEAIEPFRRGGKRLVRFRLVDPVSGESHIIERERVRTVGVVQHDGERQKRPVVQMRICIAGRVVDTEVNLVDRSEFTYPLLLGRNTLAEFALVDPAATHLAPPACEAPTVAVEDGP